MIIWEAAILHLGIAITGVFITWLVQLRTRNAGIVDVSWSYILGSAGVVYAIVGDGDIMMRSIVGILSGWWGLRLGTYLARRNIGKTEDRRYAELREQWKPSSNRKMLNFYVLQAVIAWIIGLTFLPIAYRADQPSLLLLSLGITLSAIGIVGETVADKQLADFKSDFRNHAQVCNIGLWRYSRHPNYFFECLHWFGYPLLGFTAAFGCLSLIGALVIPFLLLKVSGIPTVENRTANSRRAGYEDYVRRTSAFFPLPPRRV